MAFWIVLLLCQVSLKRGCVGGGGGGGWGEPPRLSSRGCTGWVGNASLPLNNPSISKSTRRLYGKPSTSLLSQGRSHLLGRAPGSPCRAFWFFQAARLPPHPSTPSPRGFSHFSLPPPPPIPIKSPGHKASLEPRGSSHSLPLLSSFSVVLSSAFSPP